MTEALEEKDEILLQFTSQIVASHVSNNVVPTGDLPVVIEQVFRKLESLGTEGIPEPVEELKPAVSIKKSVGEKHITCLECGKEMKMLRRHLKSDHDLSPEDYRERWGLAANYPMVAPEYSRTRQTLAKENGLGRNRRKS